jgi:hypothetical protein
MLRLYMDEDFMREALVRGLREHGIDILTAQEAGIVLVPQQRFGVGEVLRRLLRLVTMLSAADMVDRAEFLSAWEPET